MNCYDRIVELQIVASKRILFSYYPVAYISHYLYLVEYHATSTVIQLVNILSKEFVCHLSTERYTSE